MKKILMGSVVLTALSLSIIAFQMSCSKSANAQSNGTTGLTQLNLILISKFIPADANGTGSAKSYSYWTSNIDGTNQKQIPINGISGSQLGGAKLTPDGKTIIFEVSDSITYKTSLYSCSVDGKNLKKIIMPNGKETNIGIEGAY